MKCEKLFKEIDRLYNEYIQFWVDICNIESPTDNKAGVDECGRYFIEKAKAHNWSIDIHKEKISGDCICITMNEGINAAPIVFSAHLDTVHPLGSFGSPATRCDSENIYGPGVLDCKGGAVASFLAMHALESCGFSARPVKLILQSDEENGSRTSSKETVKYMCEQSKDAIAFLNAEGYNPGFATIIRKGIKKYTFEITGKACHSSFCYNGASAIREAAYKIIELEKLKDSKGLTCNCGLINGGSAENTVPEKCRFTTDIRFSTEEDAKEAARLIDDLTRKSFVEGTTCTAKLASFRVPMEPKPANYDLLEKINAIYKENGLPVLAVKAANGGSDAADLSAFGVPCIDSLGTEGGNIHSLKEFSKLSSLAESAKRLASIAYCL